MNLASLGVEAVFADGTMMPGALPIAGDATVLLAGAAANDIGTPSGGWTLTWQGQKGDVTPGTTLRAAMIDALGDRVRYQVRQSDRGPQADRVERV